MGILADPAEDHGAGQSQISAIGREAVGDLGGELAGRGEHERATQPGRGALAVARQALQDGQREVGGLAVAGLGATEQVAALQQVGVGDRLGLDPRRRAVALGAGRARRSGSVSPTPSKEAKWRSLSEWLSARHRRGADRFRPSRAAEAASLFIETSRDAAAGLRCRTPACALARNWGSLRPTP